MIVTRLPRQNPDLSGDLLIDVDSGLTGRKSKGKTVKKEHVNNFNKNLLIYSSSWHETIIRKQPSYDKVSDKINMFYSKGKNND